MGEMKTKPEQQRGTMQYIDIAQKAFTFLLNKEEALTLKILGFNLIISFILLFFLLII
jgi:hypothetical protein